MRDYEKPGVYWAKPDLANEVYDLRRIEYSRSEDFRDTSFNWLRWDQLDTDGVVLVVVDQNEVISTMRGVIVEGSTALGSRLGMILPPAFDSGPTMVLERAATQHSHRVAGFNSLLRFHLIQMAIDWRIPHVAGLIVNGTKRTKLMEELGYRVMRATPIVETDEQRFASQEDWLIASLNLETEYEKARRILIARVGTLLTRYPWCGKYPVPNRS